MSVPQNDEDAGLLAEQIRRRIAESPVCRFFGFEVLEVGEGSIALALPGKPEFGHRPGYFQGAIIGAIADHAGSLACVTLSAPGWIDLTLDYTLKFLDRAEGVRLIARARVVAPGATIRVAAADIFVVREGRERLCATALITTRSSPPKGSCKPLS